MKRLLTVMLILVLALLVMAACGGKAKNEPAAAQAGTTADVPAESVSPEDNPAADVSGEDTPVAAPGDEAAPAETSADADAAASADDESLSLDSRQVGLDKLKSYRMRWQSEWTSSDSSTAEKASWDWVEEFSSEPPALHWTWKVLDNASEQKTTNMEAWQIDNTTYMSTQGIGDQANCMSFSSEDETNQLTKGLFSPNSLGSVTDAKYVGTEAVNGVQAKHYKYDEKAAGLAGFGKVSGEIWVAVDGGFVVKDMMSWQGAAGFFGGNSEAQGDGTWTWELSDVDQPVSIEAPANCGGAANDMPIMADATGKSSFGDVITYKSASTLDDVMAFYQAEMPAAGWSAEGEPQVSDEFATFGFAKDGQKAQIIVTVDADQTQVMISVTK